MTKLEQKFWPFFASLTVCLIVASSVSWIYKHPYSISWDEAYYFNQVQTDIKVLKTEGFKSVAKAFLHTDNTRLRPIEFLQLFIHIFPVLSPQKCVY